MPGMKDTERWEALLVVPQASCPCCLCCRENGGLGSTRMPGLPRCAWAFEDVARGWRGAGGLGETPLCCLGSRLEQKGGSRPDSSARFRGFGTCTEPTTSLPGPQLASTASASPLPSPWHQLSLENPPDAGAIDPVLQVREGSLCTALEVRPAWKDLLWAGVHLRPSCLLKPETCRLSPPLKGLAAAVRGTRGGGEARAWD